MKKVVDKRKYAMDNVYRQTDRQTDRQIVVIMPAYNCKKYILEAVESVLRQPYQRIQLILIDDGSTDGTPLICDDMADHNEEIFVIHQENGGVSAARNAGINYAFSRGENLGKDCYFAFVDADDKWPDGFFDNRIGELLEKEFDLLGFQSSRCNETVTRRARPIQMEAGEYNGGVASVWISAGQHLGAMLYSVDFIKKFNLRFCNIRNSEDKIFTMQCLYLANRIHLENKLLYLYRQIKSSAVHVRATGIEYFKPIIDAYIKSDEEMLQWSNNKGEILKAGRILAGIYVMDLIDDHYQNGGFRKTLDIFLEENPSYRELVACNDAVTKRWRKMQEHPWIYKMKNRIYGELFYIVRRIYYLRPVKNIMDRKRYPVRL